MLLQRALLALRGPAQRGVHRQTDGSSEVAPGMPFMGPNTKGIDRAAEMRFQEGNRTAQLAILQQRSAEERTTRDAPASEALADQIAALEARLAQTQVRLSTLESSDASSLFTLRPIGELAITASEPKRTTTIAVAGFLGLMVGVLFVFFIYYLLEVRARERRTSQQEPPGSD